MNGNDIRLGRLFDGSSRRTFIIAYDHGLTSDAVRPAGAPGSVLERIVGCEPDGVLLSAGLLRRHGDLFARRGAPAAIVRTDWMLLGGDIPAYGERYRVVTTPGQAAAPITFTPCELEHPLHLALIAAECAKVSVPENPRQPGGRHITLAVSRSNGQVVVRVSDDGCGGADIRRTSGLADRVAALGGSLAVTSPRGRGTDVCRRRDRQPQ